jgi:hypothetical protein
MADFTILDSGALDHALVTSQDTTNAITPAIGDVAFFAGRVSVGTSAACPGGGMTWTLVQLQAAAGAQSVFVAAFRATAGTPSSGVLTFTSSDNWVDTTYAVVRPVDLVYTGVAGANDSGGEDVDTLTIPLTTSSPAGLLAYFMGHSTPATWAQDTGWTEILDANNPSGLSHNLQERFSDDTEVIGNASFNMAITGVCLEFSAAGGSATPSDLRTMPRGKRRGQRRGLAHAMSKVNGLWRPTDTRLVIPVGIALEGV